MTDEQKAPASPAPPTTRAERLTALLLKARPDLSDQINSGNWGPAGAPYIQKLRDDGTRTLVILDKDGDSAFKAVGKTTEDLITALEAQLS